MFLSKRVNKENPVIQKGKLAKFLRVVISETEVATPTKIGVHAFDINPYLQDFFEPIPIE